MRIRKIIKNSVNFLLHYFGLKLIREGDKEGLDSSVSVKQDVIPDGMQPVNNNRLSYDAIFNIRGSMEELLVLCKENGFSPATVIDVGVAYGTPSLYSVFDKSKHLLMEPIVEYEPALKKICDVVDAEYVLSAASSENGVSTIYIGGSLDSSSIMLPPTGKGQDKREITLVKLDDVCSDKRLQGPYLLKVDVQGAELLVLEGAKTVLDQCELVILEVSFFNFRPEMPDLFEVISYMHSKGFVVYEIFGGHNRPLDGARAQADIAFVKDDGAFRTTHKWTY